MTARRVALIFDNTARPETTGVYCRRAFQGLAEVEHFLPAELHRIPRTGFDLYLNVDDGLEYTLPPGLGPTAWWAIDTHLGFERCLAKSAGVDFVFAAQRDGAERLRQEGVASAAWLPLACDPGVHARHQTPKRYDVAFVGNLFPGVRAELVELLRQKFPNTFVGRRYFEEMAELYSASRVVFNRSLKNDVNMRVFEALASGSLLMTNDLEENGQDELFVPGVHLATYRGADDLVDNVTLYLKDGEARERIASVGRQEVLANHTYRRRMEAILDRAGLGKPRGVAVGGVTTEGKDGAADGGGHDTGYFDHARPEVVALVPVSARSVLDVGCGAGRLGEALKARQGCEVVGIEYDPRAAARARDRLDRVIVGDVERLDADFEPGRFDAVVCGDILEHLRAPEKLLRRIHRWLRPGGAFVASVPNVRHHSVAGSLLGGNWTYESAGLLDQDHVRFFTRRELEKLIYRAGFALDELQAVPGPGDDDWFRGDRTGEVRVGGLRIAGLPPGDADEFHTYQFLARARRAEAPERPTTSIVIVTYNQLPYTRLCVDSILRLTDEPYELIFVDNGSTDGTPHYLRTVPGARVILNEENRGFPAAVNQGLAVAKGSVLLLLNNDTVVTTGWLDRLLRAFERDAGVGLVGPCTNEISGEQRIGRGYGDLMDLDGFAWDYGKANDGATAETDRLVGFCLAFRREVMDDVGVLDERFGIGNFEDDDFCRRARAAGWRAVIALDAFVHHFGSRTFLASGVDFAGLLRTNEQLYREKWADGEAEPPAESASAPAPALPAPPKPAETKRFAAEAQPGGGLKLQTGGRVGVSLCMIVRDNAGTIRPCLESVKPWVDEMVVVDTGSTDETPRIAEELGARVFHFPWCDDFSAARNESLRHARGDWLFWMDSDDTIPPECGRTVRELADRPAPDDLLGYVMQVHCPGGDARHDVTVVDHVKLFRNRPDLRFEGRIHEQILPAIRRAGGDVAWTDAYVVHSGSDPGEAAQDRKRKRDLRLLHLENADRPDHPFTLFNLGMTHVDGAEFKEGADYLRRSIARSGPNESHLRKAYALLVYALARLERWDEAIATCREGLRRFPDDPELRFRHGVLLHDVGRLDEAAALYENLLADPGTRHFTSIDRGLCGFKARQNLAIVYTDLNEPAKAEAQWRRIVADEPGYAPGWRGLGDALIRQGRLDEADRLRERLAADPALAGEAHLLAGRTAAARGDVDAAQAAFRRAGGALPDDTEPLRVLCQVLFESGGDAEAEAALRELADRHPDDAPARHNLGSLFLRAGRYAEAVEAYRQAVRLRPDASGTFVLLGRAYQGLDRTAEAVESWHEALRLDPDNAEAAEALRRVEAASGV